MEPSPPRNHIVCQNFQRFMIEALKHRTQGTCTCLVKACDETCQCYPDLALHITSFSGQAAEFRHAISGSWTSAQDHDEYGICIDADENTRPDSSEAPLTLELGTGTVGEATTSPISGTQPMDSLDVEYTQDQHDPDTAPHLEASLGSRIINSRYVAAANDEELAIRIEAVREPDDAKGPRIIPSRTTMHSNLCRESNEDQHSDSDPEPQPATTCARKALMHAIEYSLDVQDHGSPSIDSSLSFSEARGARQRTRAPMDREGSGTGREKGRERRAEGTEEKAVENGKRRQEYKKVVRSGKSKELEDEQEEEEQEEEEQEEEEQEEEEQEEEEQEEEEQEEEEEDEEDDTVNVSPTPIRYNKVKESTRKRVADAVDPERRSTYRQSNKRPKVGTHVDIEFQTPGTTTTSTGNPIDQSFWDEWDIKRAAMTRAAMTNHDQQTDQSVKAVRVWRRLSTKHSSGFSRSRKGQDTSLRNVDKIVTMVLAVANCYAFGALKEVMSLLQQDRAAWTSEIFSNDPRVLVEAVNTIETAGHLNSYLRRFGLARLANIYLSTAANGGRLTLNVDPVGSLSRAVATKSHKAEAYSAMILHIWGLPFPAQYRGAKMTRGGLIHSTAADAMQWNKCKARLRKQIEAGQRWLTLATRVGWSTLGLITRDWSIGDSKVVASDRIFEEVLVLSEYDALLDEIDATKGRFLRQLNKALSASLFDLLKDPNRASSLPLLRLKDQDIMTRADCDPQWIDELTSLSDTPAQDL